MDPRNFTLVMRQRGGDGRLLGAVCFRPFPHLFMAEIIFFAVPSGQQVRGHGRRLMAALKNFLGQNEMWNILTYADVTAIEFFRKQGFNKASSDEPDSRRAAPKPDWAGWVKEYDDKQ